MIIIKIIKTTSLNRKITSRRLGVSCRTWTLVSWVTAMNLSNPNTHPSLCLTFESLSIFHCAAKFWQHNRSGQLQKWRKIYLLKTHQDRLSRDSGSDHIFNFCHKTAIMSCINSHKPLPSVAHTAARRDIISVNTNQCVCCDMSQPLIWLDWSLNKTSNTYVVPRWSQGLTSEKRNKN